MSSVQWMKLKLTEITSPDEIRKNKENITKLEEKINSLISQFEQKNQEKSDNQDKIYQNLNNSLNQEINNMNKVLKNHIEEFVNFKKRNVASEQEKTKHEVNRLDNYAQVKAFFNDQLITILELQNKLKLLTEKSENTPD